MSVKLKWLTTALWGLVVVGMLAVMASWTTLRMREKRAAAISVSADDGPLPVIKSPMFELVDQDGKPFSSTALMGKVWVGDFFFTSCQGPCPLLQAKMAGLEKAIPEAGVEFVSFSIDPETDTPAVLKAYAEKFGADARWHFLTGGHNATFDIARALKLPAVPATGSDPIYHTTKLVLVGRAGVVAGYYDYDDAGALKKLASDARGLLK